MRTIFKLLFIGLLVPILAAQCKTKTSSGETNTDTTTTQVSRNLAATKFDTVSQQLSSKSELMTENLIALKMIDTALTTRLSETCYCDTTVQLNDSIYYSVISVGDQAGVCSYVFLSSMDQKSKRVISSKYLHPDCDVDYSWDTYELFDHSIISKDKIQLTKTTVFQKKNRTSPNEEENIDHEQEEKSFIRISPSGQINESK
jgi:hypothetical protein